MPWDAFPEPSVCPGEACHDRSAHQDVVDKSNVRQELTDAVLGELLDVEGGRLAEEADSLWREFDAEVLQLAARAGHDLGLEFFLQAGEIESGHRGLHESLPAFCATHATGLEVFGKNRIENRLLA